jgi:hypothetical protein
MPRNNPWLSSFNAGELSPRMAARTDQPDFYPNGCRVLENFFIWRHGPAERRPGTRYIAEVKNSAKKTRLIPFEYSTEQAYVIEAGDQYFRFYKDGGRIESPPATPVEVASPYPEADLAGLMWCQSADVLYLFHANWQPRKLSRTSHTAWTLSLLEPIDGPWLEENTASGKTLAPSATSGSGITITASGHTPFAATDIGRLVRIKHSSTWGYARIVGYTDTTHVTADVKSNFGATTASASWRLGLWSDTTGWPVAGTFHEERLVMGGCKVRSQRIDGSKSNDFETFTPGTTDSDPISYNIGSNEVCAIRWLESWRKLLIGTPGGEFKMGSETAQLGLTPTNVLVSRETKNGSAAIRPQVVGNALIFVQRQGRAVREFAYDFQSDGYLANDLTLVADHVTKSGVVEIAYQQEPAGVVWAARADGMLLGCTYLKAQKVQGWHRHPMGNGAVEALAVIPGAGADELWLIVNRAIGGATKRYVEQMQSPFADDQDLRDAWFVDCGLAWSGAPATVFSGLDHLEGQSVDVLADGAPHPAKTVALGQITLDYPASRVIVGLGYVSKLETMPLEAGAPEGTA